METEKSITCQQALLASLEIVRDLRVYRCQLTGLVCVISGYGPDAEMLELACEECEKKKAPP